MGRNKNFDDILTKEYLQSEYCDKKRSAINIAKEIGCSFPTVVRYVKNFGLYEERTLRRGDISGQKFNYLTAIKKVKTNREQKTTWLCKCDCGKELEVRVSRLFNNETRSCGCKLLGRFNNKYKGTLNISASYWNSICRSAKERGYELSITIEDAQEQFSKQEGKCALTGIDLFPCESRHSSGQWTASLDRKDSQLGYIKDNIQWIHKDINRMKWHYEQDYFIELCKLVAKLQKEKEESNEYIG